MVPVQPFIHAWADCSMPEMRTVWTLLLSNMLEMCFRAKSALFCSCSRNFARRGWSADRAVRARPCPPRSSRRPRPRSELGSFGSVRLCSIAHGRCVQMLGYVCPSLRTARRTASDIAPPADEYSLPATRLLRIAIGQTEASSARKAIARPRSLSSASGAARVGCPPARACQSASRWLSMKPIRRTDPS